MKATKTRAARGGSNANSGTRRGRPRKDSAHVVANVVRERDHMGRRDARARRRTRRIAMALRIELNFKVTAAFERALDSFILLTDA